MPKIKIVDAIMGAGKTSMAIQMIKQDVVSNYIYITPFLSEVQRIKQNCNNRRFTEPYDIGSGKLDSLHNLLKDGKNIASTHALFRMANEVTLELLRSNDYILILDEVVDVIEQLPLRKDDLPSILSLKLATVENGFLIWNPKHMNYDGKYNDIKTMALNKTLMIINNTLLMWNFPVSVFNSFKEAYVLTYMFSAQIQKYYYDLHNVEYEYYCVQKDVTCTTKDKYILVNWEDRDPYDKTNIKNNINVLLDDPINKIGDNYFCLSSTWFEKPANSELIITLKNNIINYFKNKVKGKSNENMWTSFKSSKKKLSGRGYTKGFVAVNARATNEYSSKCKLAYCTNIFLNPIIKQFFIDKGVSVEEENFALSEMLQWIWRSAIRNNEKINIYIPSKRMRDLLLNWLDNEQ